MIGIKRQRRASEMRCRHSDANERAQMTQQVVSLMSYDSTNSDSTDPELIHAERLLEQQHNQI
jgi:hypothetical protein